MQRSPAREVARTVRRTTRVPPRSRAGWRRTARREATRSLCRLDEPTHVVVPALVQLNVLASRWHSRDHDREAFTVQPLVDAPTKFADIRDGRRRMSERLGNDVEVVPS